MACSRGGFSQSRRPASGALGLITQEDSQSEELDLRWPTALCLLQLEYLVKENRLGSRRGFLVLAGKGARAPAPLCGGSSWGGTEVHGTEGKLSMWPLVPHSFSVHPLTRTVKPVHPHLQFVPFCFLISVPCLFRPTFLFLTFLYRVVALFLSLGPPHFIAVSPFLSPSDFSCFLPRPSSLSSSSPQTPTRDGCNLGEGSAGCPGFWHPGWEPQWR